MGIVLKQSTNNVLSTFLGFGIGAFNTLFLYVNFMSDAYYGLVGFLLSTAMILMPFLSFGVQNTIIKFYSSFQGNARERFLLWMLLLPLFIIIPATLLSVVFQEQIAIFISSKNENFGDYFWYIFIIAVAIAYFEVFFAWSKVHLKSSFGNLMKEVFHRLATLCLLVLLGAEIISIAIFLKALVGVYVLRMLIMKTYAYYVHMPKLVWSTSPKQKGIGFPSRFGAILKYTSLIIIAGSVATLLLDLDKFMIGKYKLVENIAYYNVAIYIATVIAIPVRAMHQITYPMVAQLLNAKNYSEIAILYKKSSISLLVISSFLFLLIVTNLQSLYQLIDPTYAKGIYVVILIGFARVLDNVLGINNAILYNSDYYRLVLFLGLILVLIAIGLNIYFIPRYGIKGAAIATFMASVLYSISKIVIVYWKFSILPFTAKTAAMLGIGICFLLLFYFFEFGFHPLVDIMLKSAAITILFVPIVYRFNISEDITAVIRSILKRL